MTNQIKFTQQKNGELLSVHVEFTDKYAALVNQAILEVYRLLDEHKQNEKTATEKSTDKISGRK